jgi:hypothetical protein
MFKGEDYFLMACDLQTATEADIGGGNNDDVASLENINVWFPG